MALAKMMEKGQGVSKDLPRAYFWYDQVVKRVPEGEMGEMADRALHHLKETMTAGQLGEARKLIKFRRNTVK
jgi:TPR repeat protein